MKVAVLLAELFAKPHADFRSAFADVRKLGSQMAHESLSRKTVANLFGETRIAGCVFSFGHSVRVMVVAFPTHVKTGFLERRDKTRELRLARAELLWQNVEMSLLSSPRGPAAPPPQERDGLRMIAHYSWYLVAAVAILVALTFVYRWEQTRKVVREAAEKQRQMAAADAELMGGNRFEILQFYAYPAIIHPGEDTQICYGTSNAKDVKLDPPVANVWPSMMRCFSVTLKKSTDFTLTITDAAGHTKTQTISVSVQR